MSRYNQTCRVCVFRVKDKIGSTCSFMRIAVKRTTQKCQHHKQVNPPKKEVR